MKVENINLKSMILNYIKGIKEFTLDANGQNVSVLGDNGTGKSTLRDAFLWCLFGKDGANLTEGRGGFDIETFQPGTNEPIHDIDHVVEVTLDINGKDMKFRRMYAEKWTKKRGSAEKELTGHTTSYWIDDEPLSQKEYQERINSIIDEEIFRLLTNPNYFNEQLKWEKRRKVLLGLVGDLTDEEVIDSDPSLLKLKAILDGKSIESYKKILADHLKRLNKQKDEIPSRIDEQYRNLVSNDVDYTAIEANLSHFKDRLKAIESELADANKSAQGLRQQQQQLYKLSDAIEHRKRELADEANAGFKGIVEEKAQLTNAKIKLDTDFRSLKTLIRDKESFLDILSSDMASLRDEWKLEFAKTFTHSDDQDFVCPTCLRPFPEEEIEKKINELKANFEQNKAKRLEEIHAKGKSLAEEKKQTEEELQVKNELLLKAEAQLHDINERIAEINKESSHVGPVEANYESDPQYRELQSAYQTLKAELDKPVEDTSKELLAEKTRISQEIEGLNRVLNQKDVAEKTKTRIDELKDEERSLATQISELEGHKYLIEQFIKRKVNLLNDSISEKFKTVRFEMFKMQQNGGIEECCNTLVKSANGAWVDWNTNGNTAAKINAGMDIINTLAQHYDVTAPIFLDNRESVNELIETESQIINLVVTKDTKLRVEVA